MVRTIAKRYIKRPSTWGRVFLLVFTALSMLFPTYVTFFEYHPFPWVAGWGIGWTLFLVVAAHNIQQMYDILFKCPYMSACDEQDWAGSYRDDTCGKIQKQAGGR